MGYQPYVINDFKGLTLGDPTEVDGAIDLYNVVPGRPGEIRVRDGYDDWTTEDTSLLVVLEAGIANSKDYLIASTLSSNNKTFARDVSDGSLDATLAKSVLQTVSFGTTSSSLILCAMATSSETIHQFNGSAFAAVSYTGTNPQASRIAVQQPDNRVVIAGASLGGGSRVHFSDPDDHTTWGANNFVDLTPGDGEQIHTLVAWRDLVFAFKLSKFFVFYGNSSDADGNPVFNYRTVQVGSDRPYAALCACVAPEGVYFLGPQHRGVVGMRASLNPPGIYYTDGVGTKRVTERWDQMFDPNASALSDPQFLTYGVLTPGEVAGMHYVNNQIWLSYVEGSSPHATFVYDIKREEVFLLQTEKPIMDAVMMNPDTAPTSNNAMFVGNGTKIYSFTPTATTDDGTAIGSLYRTSYRDLGMPAQQKTIRETLLWGTGTVGAQISTDFAAPAAMSSVTLGASATAPALGRRRIAERGISFSTLLYTASGQWSVSSLTHNFVGKPRAPGKDT